MHAIPNDNMFAICLGQLSVLDLIQCIVPVILQTNDSSCIKTMHHSQNSINDQQFEIAICLGQLSVLDLI